MRNEREVGRLLSLDETAESATPDLPAFLSHPSGAPVYWGFPIIEETETDGWRYGTITVHDDPNGCESGDGFIVAPNGSRAGVVWELGTDTRYSEVGTNSVYEIMAPEKDRWGVYGVWFPKPTRTVTDVVDCFRAILPELRAIYEKLPRDENGKVRYDEVEESVIEL